jgi:POT family proton-dependent oligopeptide transporter
MFTVVADDAEFKALKDAKKVGWQDGKWVVSDEEYAKVVGGKDAAGAQTLPAGQQLKLVNPELFQSINAGFIIILAPLMAALWVFLGKRRREPSMPAKIAAGLFITGLSAVVMVGAVAAAGVPEGKVSAWWLFGTYFVITIGELCLSPIGLSLVSKLAPARLTGFLMGGWFLSTSIGNKLAGVMGETYHKWDHTFFFWFNAAFAALAAGVIFVLLPRLRRQMAMPAAPPPDAKST